MCSLLGKFSHSSLSFLSIWLHKCLVCCLPRTTIKIYTTAKQYYIWLHFSHAMHFWYTITICVIWFWENFCKVLRTFDISPLDTLTLSLSLQLLNHSCIARYSFIKCKNFNHCRSLSCKAVFKTFLPLVLCAMHSNQNKFPFCSDDWHLVLSISLLRIEPWEKSRSLWHLIMLDTKMCSWLMLLWSFPAPSWWQSDSNIYIINPQQVCNSLGCIILYGP